MKLRLTLFGLILFSLSTLAIDPAPPHVLITVINKDGVKIDSVYISSDSVFVHEKVENKLRSYGSKDLNRPLWGQVWNGCFRVKVKLANSTVYTSALIHEEKRYTNYDLTVSDGGIELDKNYDEGIVIFFRNLLIFAISAMAFRTLSLLVKLKTKIRRNYVLKYTAVTIIDLLAISAAVYFFHASGSSLVIILLLSFVTPPILDFILYKKDKNILSFNIWILILANVVFYLLLFPISALLVLFGYLS